MSADDYQSAADIEGVKRRRLLVSLAVAKSAHRHIR